MKKSLFFLSLTVFLYSFLLSQELQVTSPTRGEKLTLGTQYRIVWNPTKKNQTINLVLTESVRNRIGYIVRNVDSRRGYHSWKVGQLEGKTAQPGDRYKVMIEIHGRKAKYYNRGYFRIVASSGIAQINPQNTFQPSVTIKQPQLNMVDPYNGKKPEYLRFDSNKYSIKPGEECLLSYSFKNTEEADVFNKSNGKVVKQILHKGFGGKTNPAYPTTGNCSVKPMSTGVYLLRMKNPHGKLEKQVKITVKNDPYAGYKPLINSLKADKQTIVAGQSTFLRYEFSFAQSAELHIQHGNKIADLKVGKIGKMTSGEFKVSPTKGTAYVLICRNPNGMDKRSFHIDVRANPNTPTVYNNGNPRVITFQASQPTGWIGQPFAFHYEFINGNHIWLDEFDTRASLGLQKHDPPKKGKLNYKFSKTGKREFKLIAGYKPEKPNGKTHAKFQTVLVMDGTKYPNGKLWASPSSIHKSRSAYVEYELQDTASADFYHGSLDTKPIKIKLTHQAYGNRVLAKGKIPVAPKVTTNYYLKLHNSRGSRTLKTKLTVTGVEYPVIMTFRPKKPTMKFGEQYFYLDVKAKLFDDLKLIDGLTNKVIFSIKGSMLLPEARKNGYGFAHYFNKPEEQIPTSRWFVLEASNKNGVVKKTVDVKVIGAPLGGYDFELSKHWQGGVTIKFKVVGLRKFDIQHLDVLAPPKDPYPYKTIKSYNNLNGRQFSSEFWHSRPSNNYYPARYKFIIIKLDGTKVIINRKIM